MAPTSAAATANCHVTNGGQVSSATGSFPVALVSMIGANGGTGPSPWTAPAPNCTSPAPGPTSATNRPAAGGSDGAVTITNGGSMDLVGGFVGAKGGSGAVTVTGAGSVLQSSADLYVGSDDAGNAGNGHITVNAGGRVLVAGTLHVAPGAGTSLDVNGGGTVSASQLDLRGNVNLLDGTIQGMVTDAGTLNVGATGSHTISGNLKLTGGSVGFDLSELAPALSGTADARAAAAAAAAAPLLYVSNTLDLTGSGDALVLSGGLPGQTYLLIGVGSTMLGAFDSVTPGYRVDTTANQVYVTVAATPEPTAGAAVFTAVATLGLRTTRRRRRRSGR